MKKEINKDGSINKSIKEKLVVLSGSFDLLHPGHIYVFNKVKEILPDSKLLVILLSDENIKARKGHHRPVYNLEERIVMLEAIANVDYILPWVEPWENLREFIITLKPKYFVAVDQDPGLKNKKELVEKTGGKFIVILKHKEYSVTKIINKIKKSASI